MATSHSIRSEVLVRLSFPEFYQGGSLVQIGGCQTTNIFHLGGLLE